jgi:hypothetical protein
MTPFDWLWPVLCAFLLTGILAPLILRSVDRRIAVKSKESDALREENEQLRQQIEEHQAELAKQDVIYRALEMANSELNLYDLLGKSRKRGYVTPYEYRTFCVIYKNIKLLGADGFTEHFKEVVDDLDLLMEDDLIPDNSNKAGF